MVPFPRRWLVVPLLVVLLVVSHTWWLSAIGNELVVSDPLQPADAIIVLAGNSPARFEHAVELYQAGYAPWLIISDEEVQTHGLRTTWGDLYRRGIAPLPVPPASLFMLPVSSSTYEEALRSRDLLRQEGWRSAIVVTDPFHKSPSHHDLCPRLRASRALGSHQRVRESHEGGTAVVAGRQESGRSADGVSEARLLRGAGTIVLILRNLP